MATSKRIDEPTPNGGDYSIAYFFDEDGNPAFEDLASGLEIVEFNSQGEEIFRTHASMVESREPSLDR